MPKRSSILRGGGKISYRSISVYTKADITITINSKVQPLDIAMFGKLTDSKDDVSVEVSFEPGGEVTTGLIGLFLPFFSGSLYSGQSIFDPVTDYPLTINSRDGRVFTLVNAVCTSPASIIAAGTKTLFGAVKFTGIRANGAPWNQAGSLFTLATQAYPGDADFVRTNIIRQPFTGRWLATALPTGTITADTDANPDVLTSAAHGLLAGDTVTISGSTGDNAINGTFTVAPTSLTTNTFSLYQLGTSTPVAGAGVYTGGATFTRANVGDSFGNFTTEDGFTISPNVTLQPDKTDDGGIIDMMYVRSDVKVACTPVGPSFDDLLAMMKVQGGSAVRGGDVAADALPLYMTGAGVYIKVPLASLVEPQNILYSPTKKRLGKVNWNAETAFVANAPQPLMQVSTNPIS